MWARLKPRREEEIETESVIWLVLILGGMKDARLRSLAPWIQRATTDKRGTVKVKPKLQWRSQGDGERGHSDEMHTKESCIHRTESASPGKIYGCYRHQSEEKGYLSPLKLR